MEPVAASQRDAAADSGQMCSTICDAVSFPAERKGLAGHYEGLRGSSTTYRQGCRQSSLSARTAEAGKAEVVRRDRRSWHCWCVADASAAQVAPQHPPWEQLPWQRHEDKLRWCFLSLPGYLPHSPKSHQPGLWRWTKSNPARRSRGRIPRRTRKRRKRKSTRHRDKHKMLLLGLGLRYANPRRPSPTYPEARRTS